MLKPFLLIIAVLLPSLSPAAQNTFKPIDDAAKDASFLAFRTDLIRTVKEQDEQALLKITHPKIEYSFGDGPGKDGFTRQWKLNNGGTHELWQSILAVLQLGGTFNAKGEFVAPYVFAKWPANRDGFEYSAVIVPQTFVRAKPNARSKAIAKVGYEILKLNDASAPEGWLAVYAPGGKKGFLRSSELRSPIDFRAFFKKEEGEWKMTAFLAGD